MKVCVFGAGAVGTFIAAHLIRHQACDVAVVARGAQLDALRRDGITVRRDNADVFQVKVANATDRPETLPAQDLLLVTLKANAVPGCAEQLSNLTKPDGVAVFLQNGIPWWWNYGLGGDALDLLDPGGRLWNGFGPARALGGVIYSPNELEIPGVVRTNGKSEFIVGEPTLQSVPRTSLIGNLFAAAQLPYRETSDIRREIWIKMLLNVPLNPIAALTRSPAELLTTNQDATEIELLLLHEVVAVARATGCYLTEEEVTNVRSTRLRKGSPSMLQDVLKGRPMEVESILGQAVTFAEERKVPVPAMAMVLGLLRVLDQSSRLK